MEYPEKGLEFNLGTPEGKRYIRQSLLQFGALRGITVDKDNKVICGNSTLEKAKEIGMNIVYVDADKDTLVAIRRKDLDVSNINTQEAAIVENLCSEKNLNWNCSLISSNPLIVSDVIGRYNGEECVIPVINLADFFNSEFVGDDNQMELL